MNEVYCAALRYLVMREHSAHELTQKLLRADFPKASVIATLDLLISCDQQNDARFAEVFVRSKHNRGQGPDKIRQHLAVEHKLSETLIDTYLNHPEFDWLTLAEKVRSKKFGAVIPSSYPEQAKQMRFLQTRGFTQSQIRRLFNSKTDDLD